MLNTFFAGASRWFKQSRARRPGSECGSAHQRSASSTRSPTEAGRNAHLSGRLAAALTEKASELFAHPPTIEKVDVLAAKLPS